tara:strand:- start:281 stop:565 length:285 start_codon:yes stop_codon:yes gene_type:complete
VEINYNYNIIMDIYIKVIYACFCLIIIVTISLHLTRLDFLKFVNNNNIDIFGKSIFKPECCNNTYSSFGGCLCNTQNENYILRSRGGNKYKMGY